MAPSKFKMKLAHTHGLTKDRNCALHLSSFFHFFFQSILFPSLSLNHLLHLSIVNADACLITAHK